MGGDLLADAGPLVFHAQDAQVARAIQTHGQQARHPMLLGILQQRHQGLTDAKCIATNKEFGIELPLEGETARGQRGGKRLEHHGKLVGQPALLSLQLQMTAVVETEHPQVFDQVGQPLHLTQQALKERTLWRKYPFGQPLQAAAQDGHRGAQFVGDGGIPELPLPGHALQPFGHGVEVPHQLRRLPDRLLIQRHARIEFALCHLAQAVRHRIERGQDAPREAHRHVQRHPQCNQNGRANPDHLDPGGYPALGDAARHIGHGNGVEHIGADHREGDDAERHQPQGADDLPAQAGGRCHASPPKR